MMMMKRNGTFETKRHATKRKDSEETEGHDTTQNETQKQHQETHVDILH